MLQVEVRGIAKKVLDALLEFNWNAYVDVWEVLEGFRKETLIPTVPPGATGFHSVTVDERSAKIKLGLNRTAGNDIFIELMEIHPAKGPKGDIWLNFSKR